MVKLKIIKGYEYYETDKMNASFSIKKFGEEAAYLLACYADNNLIKLNNYYEDIDDKTRVIYSFYNEEYYSIYIDIKNYDLVKDYYWNIIKDNNTYYALSHKGSAKDHTMQKIKMHNLLNPHDANKYVVDHKNGNGLDNRKCNTRIVTHQENKQNISNKRNTTTNFNGIIFRNNKNSYECSWYENGKRKYKAFPISNYGGNDEALLAAAYFREQKEIENNYLSARYKIENKLNNVLKNILNQKENQ